MECGRKYVCMYVCILFPEELIQLILSVYVQVEIAKNIGYMVV